MPTNSSRYIVPQVKIQQEFFPFLEAPPESNTSAISSWSVEKLIEHIFWCGAYDYSYELSRGDIDNIIQETIKTINERIK